MGVIGNELEIFIVRFCIYIDSFWGLYYKYSLYSFRPSLKTGTDDFDF